jgi:hypothetical protein
VECIVISKKFFLSHCTEAMKRRLLLEVSSELDNWTLLVTALPGPTRGPSVAFFATVPRQVLNCVISVCSLGLSMKSSVKVQPSEVQKNIFSLR